MAQRGLWQGFAWGLYEGMLLRMGWRPGFRVCLGFGFEVFGVRRVFVRI